MRRKRGSRTLLALSLLVAALAGGLFGARPWAGGDPATVRAQDASNAMAVDADATTAAVDASITRALGAEFDVSVNITAAPTPYQGYQAKVRFDPSILSFISVDPLGVVYTGLGGMSLNAPVPEPTQTSIYAGSAREAGTTSETGAAHIIRFRCIATGTSPLHLVTTDEEASFGTTTMAGGGLRLATSVTDAQVTCGEGGAPPPTPAASPTPGGASPTPSGGPAPTATPLPPGLEAVDLIAGCNPVASTYPDATPTQTIADRVGPAGNLASVWKFDLGTWLGYSPQFPEVSDLTVIDFLDAVFICVNGPGAFVRPIV